MARAAPSSPSIKPPSTLLALTELPRALFELGALPFATPLLSKAPRGDGHPVLVLPGFIATDASTGPLRRFLCRTGYDAHEWQLGRNLGPKAVGRDAEKLIARLRAIHDAAGERVSLVGWSLGGVMARIVARRAPDAVRQIITLGSPFSGSPRASTVWRAYEALAGHKVDDPITREQLRESSAPPSVPSTAIYSREDGIVAWRNCIGVETATSENIEVRGSHCGLVVNAAVLYAVASRLWRSR